MSTPSFRGLVPLLLVAFAGFAPERPASAEQPTPVPYAPTSAYRERQLDGWTLLVRDELLDQHPGLAHRCFAELRQQFYLMRRRVPAGAIEKLRQVRIWVELDDPNHPCACYHPGVDWLREHGMNPDKVRCVEIANAERFLEWTHGQPWMLLHELAHAYHHQFLEDGYGNDAWREAHARAAATGSYDNVLRQDGSLGRHYALNNPQEYFAELTECYFGTNDFYPFVRAELLRHDPRVVPLLEESWGVPAPRRAHLPAEPAARKE